MHQLLELKRLRDEALRAQPRDLDRLFDRGIAGDHDRDDVGIAAERFVENLPAVDAWQPKVGDEDVEGEIVEPGDRILARARLLDLKSLVDQALGDHLAERRLVIDQQQV